MPATHGRAVARRRRMLWAWRAVRFYAWLWLPYGVMPSEWVYWGETDEKGAL